MNLESQSEQLRAAAVSVIINCLNSEKYLREAIDSVYKQSFKDWEIILWDNNSTDKTAEIAKSYDSKLKYFKGSETVPLGQARNLALEKAGGDYIAFLDSDDIWLPEKLELQVPLFENPKVGLVYSDTYFFNESGKETQLYKNTKPCTGNCFRELLAHYFLSMETVIIRKSALVEQKYYFDPEFEMIEEADLFRRIAMNWEIDMVNIPLAKWRMHNQSYTWKYPDKLHEETEVSLEKYSKMIPNFREKYCEEIEILERDINLGKFKSLWKIGENKKARSLLRPYRNVNVKFKIFYFLSFFPKKTIDPIFSFFGKMP